MKFLVFQHVPHENPGLIKEWAKERGVKLKILKLWQEYTMPEKDPFDALIIMGGPMGVYENYPSEKDELKFIRSVLGKTPIIGFCLGCQLLAHALGAKVYPNIKRGKKVKEIGYCQVEFTASGKKDPLYSGFPSPLTVLQWHGDAFDLPAGAKLLASSKECKNQAFVFGKNAYGMLFHNEFTPKMIIGQIKIDKTWIHTDHEIDEEELKKEAVKREKQMRKQCFLLMDNFLKIVRA